MASALLEFACYTVARGRAGLVCAEYDGAENNLQNVLGQLSSLDIQTVGVGDLKSTPSGRPQRANFVETVLVEVYPEHGEDPIASEV